MAEDKNNAKAKSWLIARCSNHATLTLAVEFQEVGIACWAPRFVGMKRLPHTRKPRECTSALLPGFIFVDSEGYQRVEALYQAGAKTAGFSWFMFLGERVHIEDDELDGLRFVALGDAAIFSKKQSCKVLSNQLEAFAKLKGRLW